MRLFCPAKVQAAHSLPLRAKQTSRSSVTWGDASHRIRKRVFLDEGRIGLLASCTQPDKWLQPVSRVQPGQPAFSTQHIGATRLYLMWHTWHHLESCKETLPMINSSSDTTIKISFPVFTPGDASAKLRTPAYYWLSKVSLWIIFTERCGYENKHCPEWGAWIQRSDSAL